MTRLRTSLIGLLWLTVTSAFAQKSDTLLAKDNVMIPLPTVSINFGFNHLMSDVKLNSGGPSPFRQFGYQLTITQQAAKFLNVSFDLYAGTVYGEEQRNETNLNFRTTLFSQRLTVEYNFFPLLKPGADGRQLIRPYVGVGVGLLSFRSKVDLLDENGVAYQYWSDGTINAEVEGTIPASEATRLTRDLEYETDLRDANLDGLRKYPQTAFSLPLNAGVRFQITKNIGVNAAFTYAFNFSDMLDNVSADGVGDRQGSAGYDNHLFGSIGLSVFLGQTRPSAKPQRLTPAELAQAARDRKAEEKKRSSETSEKKPSEKADESTAKAPNAAEDLTQLNTLKTASDKATEMNDAYLKTLNESSEKLIANRVALEELQRTIPDSSRKITAAEKRSFGELIVKQEAEMAQLKVATTAFETERARLSDTLKNSNASPLQTRSSENETAEQVDGQLAALSQLSIDAKKAKTTAELQELAASLSQTSVRSEAIASEELQTKKEQLASEQMNLLQARIALLKTLDGNDALPETERTKVAVLKTELETDVKQMRAGGTINEDNLAELEEALGLNRPTAPTEVITETEPTSEGTTAATEPENAAVEKPALKETASEKLKEHSVMDIKNAPPKETGDFHWADLNGNGWISPDEVLHFIDLLFEGGSERTVEDIQVLIDHYFEQE